MDVDDLAGAGDPGALDALYRRFLADPHDVPRDLARAFAALGAAPGDGHAHARLVAAWRRFGHEAADLDPLAIAPRLHHADLDPGAYGLADVGGLARAYGGTLALVFDHVVDPLEQAWLAQAMERPPAPLEPAARLEILRILQRIETFEHFLQQRFSTSKRFGSDGIESFVLAVETIVQAALAERLDAVVAGGMHRGRLTIMGLPFAMDLTSLLAAMAGASPWPEPLAAAGDVPYHLGCETVREQDGHRLRLSLGGHPSHLEVIGPVTLGRARARQRQGQRVLPLVMHTDASFAGQGVVAETFQLAGLAPFDVGGTVHVLANNRLGFTTEPEEARTARHATDIARLTGVPVFRVNADDPEAVVRGARLAVAWRQRFGRDVILDVVGYRRFGHNEFDEPRFTQPRRYARIDAHPPVTSRYRERQAAAGLDVAGIEADALRFRAELEAAFQAIHEHGSRADAFAGAWQGFRRARAGEPAEPIETGVELAKLRQLADRLTAVPDGFVLEPKVERFLGERRASIASGGGIGFAAAEALALASLGDEGFAVRLGGQDTVRGAFTQRHLVLHDQATGRTHPVLGEPEVFNSPLIEYAVLAFEYGYSLEAPRTLVAWEAQFGDFLNLGQAVMDQFVTCGEDRWLRSSGLVLLLPHGLDGGGPDHSTCHPERLLAAAMGGELVVVHPSTPANLFHALRRQLHWPFRKPLAVLAPKALLRHKQAVSDLAEFGPGTGFRCVIALDVPAPARIVMASGKLAVELEVERRARGLEGRIALVRLEQLWPLDEAALAALFARHPAAELVYAQEEPLNMGPFLLLDRTLERLAGRRVSYAGRPAAASPAAGYKARHERERAAVLEAALGGLHER
ncbi:MAG: 2-oxoglutarate dehydrogenase E1 component [Geminicoccaceae bacterium]|nr:MAG: 2-oxoglutarate dehydrogenase E1 component [Geminicoccaceae bacterium]